MNEPRWHEMTYTEIGVLFRELIADRDRWRDSANALKQWLDKSYCWHCGVEPERCVYTDEAVEKYDKAVAGG